MYYCIMVVRSPGGGVGVVGGGVLSKIVASIYGTQPVNQVDVSEKANKRSFEEGYVCL